jgi:hypothetical protein
MQLLQRFRKLANQRPLGQKCAISAHVRLSFGGARRRHKAKVHLSMAKAEGSMADDTPGEKMRFEIPPKDTVYVDQFWSGMYGNLYSFGWSEQRLIWMRYSAFLIVHGIIFGFLKDSLSKPDESACILFFAGILGLVICSMWGFLNYLINP